MKRTAHAKQGKNGRTPPSLTPKQKAAAGILASGAKTKVDAFREVYDTSASKSVTREMSSDVINPTVIATAMSLIPEPLHPELRDPAYVRRKITNRLHDWLESDSVVGSLKAAELLGKIPRYDLWEERTRSEQDRTSDDIAASLEDKVSVLLGLPAAGDVVVDVSPIAHGNLQFPARDNPDEQVQSNQQQTLDLDK